MRTTRLAFVITFGFSTDRQIAKSVGGKRFVISRDFVQGLRRLPYFAGHLRYVTGTTNVASFTLSQVRSHIRAI